MMSPRRSASTRIDPSCPPADPYSLYAALRAEGSPYWSEELRAWMVLDFATTAIGLRDSSLSSYRSRIDRMPTEEQVKLFALREFYEGWLMFMDGHRHESTRAAVARLLDQDVISYAVEAAATRSTAVLNRISSVGTADFVGTYAVPVAGDAVARLVGIPAADGERVQSLSHSIVAFLGQPVPDLELGLRAQADALELLAYIRSLLQDHRCAEGSLLGNLIRSSKTSHPLQADELIVALANILVDGHDPVVAALTNSLIVLDHAKALPLRAASPRERDMVIEETLRADPPFQYVSRVASRDMTLGSSRIRTGERVLFIIASANRDATIFDDAEDVHLDRLPNQHLSFGYGPHYCIGARVARQLLRRLLPDILSRLPSLTVARASIGWIPSWGYRATERLDIHWSPPGHRSDDH